MQPTQVPVLLLDAPAVPDNTFYLIFLNEVSNMSSCEEHEEHDDDDVAQCSGMKAPA